MRSIIKPKNAIILAAGFGMRMVPINLNVSKALLEVKGEKLIERLIRQLHAADIQEIYVVTGFMSESLEYLEKNFGVTLIHNEDYAVKNNLHSLCKAIGHLSDTYILPCDVWFENSPFSEQELGSWYMVCSIVSNNSIVRMTRDLELLRICSHLLMYSSQDLHLLSSGILP